MVLLRVNSTLTYYTWVSVPHTPLSMEVLEQFLIIRRFPLPSRVTTRIVHNSRLNIFVWMQRCVRFVSVQFGSMWMFLSMSMLSLEEWQLKFSSITMVWCACICALYWSTLIFCSLGELGITSSGVTSSSKTINVTAPQFSIRELHKEGQWSHPVQNSHWNPCWIIAKILGPH